MTIIDGKKVSADLQGEISQRVKTLQSKGVTPGLAVILVGADPASQIYVRRKAQACERTGIYSEEHRLSEETTQVELLNLIEKLANDSKIHGILVQLPLPKHISEEAVIAAIPPEKDVDAFHPNNVGAIMIGDFQMVPCTPGGVMALLKAYDIDIKGKECVIIGRSNIVGKPMSMLLLHKHGTVTICHSRTRDLAEVCRRADILVAAIGKPRFVTADMVKEGAVVIDVGINRLEDGKICGDVDYDAVAEKASFITPVPGGVGPMTITLLLENTMRAAESTIG